MKAHQQWEPPADFAEQAERLMLAGKLAGARELCVRMQTRYRKHFQPHYLMGVVCMQEGNMPEAHRHLRTALNYAPNNVDIHFSLVVALRTLGRLQEALEQTRVALRLSPEDAELHRLLGNILLTLGRSHESEISFLMADQLEQDATRASGQTPVPAPVVPARNAARQRVLEPLQNGSAADAERDLRALIAETPDWADAHFALGEALLQQGRRPEAEASYRTAITLDDRQADYLRQLGLALVMQGKPEEAVSAYRKALALTPDAPEVRGHLGLALALLGSLSEGERQCDQALQQAPHLISNLVNSARIASLKGDYEGAHSLLEQALALEPDDERAHLNLAVLLLKRGDYARGWREYEWRSRLNHKRCYRSPLWDGSALPYGTILVHTEQGIGDTLQFVRFLRLVKERVGCVVLQHQPELTLLLQNLVGCDVTFSPPRSPARPDVSTAQACDIQHDVQVPLLSLPFVLGIDTDIPVSGCYLTVAEDLQRRWRQRFSPVYGYKIGLVWAGNPRHVSDRLRSMSLADFGRFAEVDGIQCYGLQTGEAAKQAEISPPQFPFTDLSLELRDFADTAAAIMNLDLIITVDTSVAHLAGAMGRPVWTLLPFDPDWRWLLKREDSPWYPTMRLFRQPRPGDWASVISDVCRELSIAARHFARA